MAAKKASGSGNRNMPPNAKEWNEGIRQTLDDLRDAAAAFPKLFPGGITKIDVELQVQGGVTLKFLVEGPSGGSESLFALPQLAFEFQRPPESLRTDASPAEGTPPDQAKLKAGTTIEGAAKVFDRNCLKKVSSYPNNCAHYLSDAFIEAGFAELVEPNGCVSSEGRCGLPNCKSGGKRLIKAKEVKCWFGTKNPSPVTSVKPKSGFYAVYQQRQSDGQEHVVILDSDAWRFYGTGWFEAGLPAPDDWKHQYFQW